MLFSEESEKALLSTLIKFPHTIYQAVGIHEEMFSSTPHRLLFRSIRELSNQGLTPDGNLLIQHLTSVGNIDEAGGVEYINFLNAKDCKEANLSEYMNIVLESYRGRTLISTMNQVPNMINNPADVGGVIDYIREVITNLLTTTGARKIQSVLEIGKGVLDEIVERSKNPGMRGQSTGFKKLDLVLGGANPDDLILIAGRPGMGKSTVLANSIVASGEPSLVFSFEMSPEAIYERMLSLHSGVPLTNLRQGFDLTGARLETLKQSNEYLSTLPIYFDNSWTGNLNTILNTIRQYHAKHGITAVYLDYVQLMAERGDNATHELGRISRSLKLLAKELHIVIYLLSQLNRGVEARDDKRPLLSDLRQSGNLEEDADVVIFLYRDILYNSEANREDMEFIIGKNRNGSPGIISVKFKEHIVKIEG